MVTRSDLVQNVIARLREERLDVVVPLLPSQRDRAEDLARFVMRAGTGQADERRVHLVARAALYALAVEQADEADKQRGDG